MITNKKTVAICGAGASLKDLNFKRTIEIWGLNHHYRKFKRWDLWFDMHKSESIDKHVTQANFPLPEAIKLRGKHFRCGISYMIAYAVLQGYERIEIYGADFNSPKDSFDFMIRIKQKNCVMRWLNFALGRNIEIFIAPSSPLNEEEFLYGYNGKIF